MRERFVRPDRVTGLAAFYEGRRRPHRGSTRVSYKIVENGLKSAQIASRTKRQPYVKANEVSLHLHSFILVLTTVNYPYNCYQAFVAGYLTTTVPYLAWVSQKEIAKTYR